MGTVSGRDVYPSTLLVPWSRKSIAIPLLALMALRPIQSLSACTRVYFTYLLLISLSIWCKLGDDLYLLGVWLRYHDLIFFFNVLTAEISISYKQIVFILIVMYVLFWVLCFIVWFSVLFMCKCVLYYCQQVSTESQLSNISYQFKKKFASPSLESYQYVIVMGL